MQSRNLVSLGVVLAAVLTVHGDAFYAFKDGNAGEDVVSVANYFDTSKYVGTATASVGASVKFSSDVPGRKVWSSHAKTQLLASDIQSLDFTTNPDNNALGGVVKMDALAGDLVARAINKESFTIEWFGKTEMVLSWRDMMGFWAQTSLENNRFIKYCIQNLGIGCQMKGANPVWRTVDIDSWHHIALVYDGAGVFNMYCDGACFDTQSVQIIGENSDKTLHFGANAANSECFDGKLAALRVTERALTPAEFMCVGDRDEERAAALGNPMGIWTFDEGTVGEAVSCAPSAVDADDCFYGARNSMDVVLPVYSDDVPGKALYTKRGGVLITDNAKSVKFTPGDALLSNEMRPRIVAAGAYTLEFFAKTDVYTEWMDYFSMYLTQGAYYKVADRSTRVSVQVSNIGENTNLLQANTTYGWHHYAIEWDATSKKFTTFIDYQEGTTLENVAMDTAGKMLGAQFGCAVGLSGENLDGKIFGVRITPARLASSDFMVVGDAKFITDAAASETVFLWTFEHDMSDNMISALPYNISPFCGKVSVSGNVPVPQLDSNVYKADKSCVTVGGVALDTNTRCRYFTGYTPEYDNNWNGGRIENFKNLDFNSLRPESFTLEMFLRRDMAEGITHCGANGELLFVFGADGINVPASDSDVRVFFAAKNAYSDMPLTFEFLDADGAHQTLELRSDTLNDGDWHHLALTYDNDTQTATVYVDYAEVRNITLTNPLRRTPDRGWTWGFGRGSNAGGFVGWMDDIRLSSGVLSTSRMLRHSAGLRPSLIFIR